MARIDIMTVTEAGPANGYALPGLGAWAAAEWSGEGPGADAPAERRAAAPTVDRMQETIVRQPSPVLPDASPIPGSRFGRYVLLDELGRGAMADVFTAYDDQLDRKIAIKLIRDPEHRVRREAQAIARVSHPNVIQVYEVGTIEGHDFIAMELVDGINLTTWQRIRSRNVYDIVAMYAAAGRGLVAAHQVGLVHRDFKPDNVLVDRNGRPRVGDFGLACTRGAALRGELEATLESSAGAGTRDDAIVGTPAYMAPEQFVSPDVDERADQFSLCAALYEAVYAVRPFAGTSLEAIRDNARAGALQAPLRGVSAPPSLLAALRRGLAADPADRWPSLAGLLDRLDAIDAYRDPAAAARERRRLVFAIVAAAAIAMVVPFTKGTSSIEDMVVIPAAILVVACVGVYLGRATLLGNAYHRRMITLMFTGIIGYIVIPLVTAPIGLSVDQIVVVEMLAMGQFYLIAAVVIERLLILNWVVPWAAAIAIACGAPTFQAAMMSSLLIILVFAMSWSRVPAARSVFSRITATLTARHSR